MRPYGIPKNTWLSMSCIFLSLLTCLKSIVKDISNEEIGGMKRAANMTDPICLIAILKLSDIKPYLYLNSLFFLLSTNFLRK